MSDLRSKLIRLAHATPTLRLHLLPLIKEADAEAPTTGKFEEGKPADPTKNMSPEDAKEWKLQNLKNKDNFKAASRLSSPQSDPKVAQPLSMSQHGQGYSAGRAAAEAELPKLIQPWENPVKLDVDVTFIIIDAFQDGRRMPRGIDEDNPQFWEWDFAVAEGVVSVFQEEVQGRMRIPVRFLNLPRGLKV